MGRVFKVFKLKKYIIKMESILFGQRIPKEYFLTSGSGESDVTVHAGSFDMALMAAGIHNQNIIVYSSILPATAVEIPKKDLTFGAVAETIMATAEGKKGENITAGIIYGWVYDKNNKKGGLVAEYHGHGSKEEAEKTLRASLDGMFKARFPDGNLQLKDVKIKIESFTAKKEFGSAIVALVFTSYDYPKLEV